MVVNISELKQRGWTDSAIRKFLGEPDKLKPNPHYKKAPPMRLYDSDRVEQTEESEEWKEWYQKSLDRREKQSQAMQESAQKKRQELIEKAKAMLEYHFPEKKPTPQAVISHWWENRQNHELSRDRFDAFFALSIPAQEDLDAETLNRWAQNMLRHEYTNYDEICLFLGGEIGKEEAYNALRGTVDKAIDEYLEGQNGHKQNP
jgi:hypothetical protein